MLDVRYWFLVLGILFFSVNTFAQGKLVLHGFLQGNTVHGRPLDVFKLSPDSFLISDDHDGVVYLVRRKN